MNRVLITLFLTFIFLSSCSHAKDLGNGFELVGQTLKPHVDFQLTKLKDGKILISEFRAYADYIGSNVPEEQRFFKVFEIYNPKTKQFEEMAQPVYWHSNASNIIVLDDGRVLLAGGAYCHMEPYKPLVTKFRLKQCLDSQYNELYDPGTDTFKVIDKMNVPRRYVSASKLNDGRVLFTHGDITVPYKFKGNGYRDLEYEKQIYKYPLNAEIYDPKTEKFTIIGKILNHEPSPFAKQYTLDNGEVLIIGFTSPDISEIYNPKENKFRKVSGSLYERKNWPPAANSHKLKDGRIIVLGGSDDAFNSVEIFDPETERFYDGGKLPIPIGGIESGILTVALADGNILLRHCGVTHINSIWKGRTITNSHLIYNPNTQKSGPFEEMPKGYILQGGIALDDDSTFLIVSKKGKMYGLIYRNSNNK